MLAPRTDYPGDGLSEAQLAATPFQQARLWLQEAIARAATGPFVPEPTALSVATVDGSGVPDVRTVLMRFFEPEGLGFVTSLESAKSRQLLANPAVAASLTWPSLYRAIRVRGHAERIAQEVVSDYFVTRPWGSRISAWASRQSSPIDSREALERQYAEVAARYPDTGDPADVPVPPGWVGWRIVPDEVEFWAGRSSRLHDRLVFTRTAPGTLDNPACWALSRRQP